MKQKITEIDILNVKLEQIEKRLDHLERMVMTGQVQGNNNDLVHLLIDMLRTKETKEVIKESKKSEQPNEDTEEAPEGITKDIFSGLALGRRRTLI